MPDYSNRGASDESIYAQFNPRPAESRLHQAGLALGWLDSDRTFSFGGLFDPKPMRFCTLRLINEDRVLPGSGFGAHSHHDMEILTYVLEGAIEHQDSLGNGAVLIQEKYR